MAEVNACADILAAGIQQMKRIVVSVATGERYGKMQDRLSLRLDEMGEDFFFFRDVLPQGCPPHSEVPYAMKPWALTQVAREFNPDLILWADSSIYPIRPLEPLWAHIEREGAWIHDGGWKNGQWCADSWYADCFPHLNLPHARHENMTISHVVATTFGLNLRSDIGQSILTEYFRLASETNAFKGPWWNSNGEREDYRKMAGAAPCGPPTTLGHRHDQSCLSIIAHRHGVKLTEGAEFFDYARYRKDGTFHPEDQDERTILVAHGAY